MHTTIKTAIVTGGLSGIGLALSLALVRKGVHVLVLDLLEVQAAGKILSEAVGKDDHCIEYRLLDVSDFSSFSTIFRAFLRQHRRIDYFFANAGVTEIPLFDSEQAEISANLQTIEVNLVSFLRSVPLVLSQMKSQERDSNGKRGSIISTSSICGLWPTPGLAMYSASKAGLIAFVESYGPWLVEDGITLNAVCPAMVATNFGDEIMYVTRKDKLTDKENVVAKLIECATGNESGKIYVVTRHGAGEAPKRPPFDRGSASDISYMERGMRAVHTSKARL